MSLPAKRSWDSAEPVIAADFRSAEHGEFVHLDRHGHVRSPTRYRMMNRASGFVVWVAPLPLIAAYAWLFGPLGALVAAAVCAYPIYVVLNIRRLSQAAALIMRNDLAAAEAILVPMSQKPLLRRRHRAIVHHNLASCASLRGEFEVALEHIEAAKRPWRGSSHVLARRILYSEVLVLIELDRIAEAEQKLAELGPEPESEYLRLSHWTAELYVAFIRGSHGFDEAELHARAKTALAITTSAPVLALLAWAHYETGARDQADHLLAEARDRDLDRSLRGRFRRLRSWLEHQQTATQRSEEPR